MSAVTAAVVQWVRAFVIGHGLCPFAARPMRAGRVVFTEVGAADTEQLFYATLEHLRAFVDPAASTAEASDPVSDGSAETYLLIYPDDLADFDDFLDFVATVEDFLAQSGADALVQLAHFHPRYRFADAADEDPGNRTNRSPYPVLQLLRVDGVARAVAAYPDVAGIPQRNVALMRALFSA